jgi:hypothetical protein
MFPRFRSAFLCAPEGDSGSAPAAAPAAPAPAAEPKKEEAASGPVETVVRDVARIKEKIGLDAAAPVPTKKKEADEEPLWCTRLFG